MYGKLFASLYSGSMFGKPAIVFAVWSYAIANMRPARITKRRAEGATRPRPPKDGSDECYVEINPALLAATFSTTPDDVLDALLVLESPDPKSRDTREGGRRLVRLGEHRHAGPMQFRVVNGARYAAMRDEDTRRAQNRDAKAAQRWRERQADIADIADSQPRSAHVDVDSDEDTEEDSLPSGERVSPRAQIDPALTSGAPDRTRARAHRLSALLRELILANRSTAKVADPDVWAPEMDKILRLDKREPGEVEAIIRFAQGDDFWRANVLSPASLRKHYDKLAMKLESASMHDRGKSKDTNVKKFFAAR